MRTKKALKNTTSSVVSYILLALVAFVVQRVFKDCLGKEYLGISSLFSNIMTGLGIVELGFGSAIIVNMYRPVANKDILAIVALMQFYKKIYRIIAFIVLAIGLMILPFTDYLVGDLSVPFNVKVIFLLYLSDSVISYFLTYKRSILYANQQNYYITWIHTVVYLAVNLLQILLLYTTANFYLYILVSMVSRLVENIIINIIADKMYPYLRRKERVPLDGSIKADIKKKVHGLIFHKLASFLVTGTDNIIISLVPGLGVIMVGVYSCYSMIITKLTGMIDALFNSITSGVGNLLIEDNKQKSYEIFKVIHFIVTWIYVFVSICFYFISVPFIEIWMGEDFVLDRATVLVITCNMFIGGCRASFGTFKSAAGIFYEDRYVPFMESVVNLITSIPLAFAFGVKGVLLGTICSTLFLYIFSYPRYVYRLIFNKGWKVYTVDCMKSVLQFAISFLATLAIMHFVNLESVFIELIVTAIVCCIVPNVIMLLMNFDSKEFLYVRITGIRLMKDRKKNN